MDTTNLAGRLIQFTKPIEDVDFENLQPGDWKFLSLYKCPVMNGSPIPPLGNNTYWFVDEHGVQPPSYDSRLLILNEDARPTNVKSTLYPNYNMFYFKYTVTNRTVEEVTQAIITEEKLANANLDREADVSTMNTFVQGYLCAIADGIPATEAQINAYNRQGDVQLKKAKNADNRLLLIEQLTGGNFNIDISAGWNNDNIAPGGYPFSN
jgi:hypothetical protein